MAAIKALFSQREARLALGIWALIPTLFLFFAITLAVDPTTQLGKLPFGMAVLDIGADTPQGHISIGSRLVDGLRQQLPVEIVTFSDEGALREAVLNHKVAGGIIFPANMTRNLQTKQPVTLPVIKSEGNDPFSMAFTTNLQSQIVTNLNTSLPGMQSGQPPIAPLVSAAPQVVATSTDFRFPIIPAALVLPIWLGAVAFGVFLSRAGNRLRENKDLRPVEVGLAELAVGVIGAVLVAAVITFDLGLFTWHWGLDFVGIFTFLGLGALATAWLILGAIRLFGLVPGALIGVLALFIQQPVSGAGFPPSFAPDAVRWAAEVSPLRYLVEGLRNLLIGGNTTGAMASALALLAGAGLVLYLAGMVRLALLAKRPHRQSVPTV
jgi:uncharacterized phage infection (PIP) family protein YhgE